MQMDAEQRNQIYKKWKEEYESRLHKQKEFRSLQKWYYCAYAFILLFMAGAYLISCDYAKYGFTEAYNIYQYFIYTCPLCILILAIHELILYKKVPDPYEMEIDDYFIFLSHSDINNITKVLAMPRSEHAHIKDDSDKESSNCTLIGLLND